jgi:hypothetical protein
MVEKATILIGKEKGLENYQLLIDGKCISVNCRNLNGDYHRFLYNLSGYFAETIHKKKGTLEVEIINGFKMEEKERVKIEKLDLQLFGSIFNNRLEGLCGKNKSLFPINLN